MCDKCKDNHKQYICVCGKEFDNSRSLQGHERTCKEYKNWKIKQEEIIIQEKESRRLPNGLFICEECGKEHNGSYGSGRFCCKKCRCKHNWNKQDYSKRLYSEDKKEQFTCQYCGKVIKSKSSLKNHEKHFCKQNPNRDLNFGSRHDWPCKLCNFIGYSRRDLQNHIKEQHQYGQIGTNGKYCWNKGLTKETDQRVANNAKAVQQSMKLLYENGYDNPNSPFCSSYWTDEKKLERSEQKKELYKEHPEKHPNAKCSHNKKFLTYPEQLAEKWFNEQHIQAEHNYFIILDGHRRYVDFYIPAKNLFIEIDGEHWHSLGNEHDKLKDEIATKHGYKTLRIRYPSMHVTNTLIEYFNSLS